MARGALQRTIAPYISVIKCELAVAPLHSWERGNVALCPRRGKVIELGNNKWFLSSVIIEFYIYFFGSPNSTLIITIEVWSALSPHK